MARSVQLVIGHVDGILTGQAAGIVWKSFNRKSQQHYISFELQNIDYNEFVIFRRHENRLC